MNKEVQLQALIRPTRPHTIYHSMDFTLHILLPHWNIEAYMNPLLIIF